MAVYRLDIQSAAERDLARLATRLRERVADVIDRLAEAPRPRGAEKLAALHTYRVRVGDYRVVYQIDDRAKVVTVIRVRHRREVYRRLR